MSSSICLTSAGGFLASAWWAPDVPSIGASAGIFGLIGAMIALGVRDRSAYGAMIRSMYTRWALYGLALGILPAFFGISFMDNAAHIGGVTSGFVIAYVAGTPRFSGATETLWRVGGGGGAGAYRVCVCGDVPGADVGDEVSRLLANYVFRETRVPRGIVHPHRDQVFTRRQIRHHDPEPLLRRIGHAVGGLDRRPRARIDRIFAAPQNGAAIRQHRHRSGNRAPVRAAPLSVTTGGVLSISTGVLTSSASSRHVQAGSTAGPRRPRERNSARRPTRRRPASNVFSVILARSSFHCDSSSPRKYRL